MPRPGRAVPPRREARRGPAEGDGGGRPAHGAPASQAVAAGTARRPCRRRWKLSTSSTSRSGSGMRCSASGGPRTGPPSVMVKRRWRPGRGGGVVEAAPVAIDEGRARLTIRVKRGGDFMLRISPEGAWQRRSLAVLSHPSKRLARSTPARRAAASSRSGRSASSSPRRRRV